MTSASSAASMSPAYSSSNCFKGSVRTWRRQDRVLTIVFRRALQMSDSLLQFNLNMQAYILTAHLSVIT